MPGLPGGQLINGRQQFIGSDGQPLVGGKVYHYTVGTLTPITTYKDVGLTTPNTWPIELDAAGMAQIFVSLLRVRQILKDINGVTIWDQTTQAVPNATNVVNPSPFSEGLLVLTDAAEWSNGLGFEPLTIPQHFGAVGDGTTDDSAAFIAALAANDYVRVPWTSAGYNLGSTVITVGTGKVLDGEAQVLLKSTATTCLLLTGYNDQSQVRNLRFDMTGAPAGSSAIRYDTSAGVIWRSGLENLRFDNCVCAISDDVGGTYIVEIMIRDILCTLPRGPQVYLSNTRGFILMENVFVDCTLSATPLVTWDSIILEQYIGIELRRVDVVGQAAITTQVYDAGAVGIRLQGNPLSVPPTDRFVWMDRVRVESSMGPGIQISDTQFIFGRWVETFACLGIGILCEDANYILADSWYARGAADQAGPAANAAGMAFTGCSKLSGSNFATEINTGDGILIRNSVDFQIDSIRSWDNDGYGVMEDGTSNRNTITSANLDNNVLGTYSLVGSQSCIGAMVVEGVRRPGTPVCSFIAVKDGATVQTVLSATFTKVTFPVEQLDAGGHYSTVDSRWTPPAGTYRLSATISITSGLVDQAELTILLYKNGAALASVTDRASGTVAPASVMINWPVVANGTDYYEIFTFLGGAGNKDLSPTVNQTIFSGSPL